MALPLIQLEALRATRDRAISLVIPHAEGSRSDALTIVRTRLPKILQGFSGSAVVPRIIRVASTKPFLEGGDCWFSISHGARRSLLAISARGEVGCDLEDRLRPDDHVRLGPSVLAPDEEAHIRSLELPDRAAGFARCWVRKEAAMKASGRGFASNPKSVLVQPGICLPEMQIDGARYLLHDAPAALDSPAAVACRDEYCDWYELDAA